MMDDAASSVPSSSFGLFFLRDFDFERVMVFELLAMALCVALVLTRERRARLA